MTLRERREALGLLQRDVAEVVDVAAASVSNWERGKNGIARKYAKRLAKLYGCPVKEIMSKEEQ